MRHPTNSLRRTSRSRVGLCGRPERPGQTPLDLQVVEETLTLVKAAHPGFELWLEPGRFLVAQGGVLLARVTQVKRKGEVTYVGLETGMTSLIRPALYGAYHPIVNLTYADFSAADLEWAELGGADLSWANLSRADLSRANLRGADLHGTDLRRANLDGADLGEADLAEADLHAAKYTTATAWPAGFDPASAGAHLIG